MTAGTATRSALVLNKDLHQATAAWREALDAGQDVLAGQYADAIEQTWGSRPTVPAPAPATMKARRGDLVAVVVTRRDFVIGQGTSERLEVDLRVVTSVTRDGAIKATRTSYGSVIPRSRELYASPKYMVVGQDEIDVAGALDAYSRHTYEGHTTVKACESLDEARDLLRPFLRAQ